MSTGKKIVYAFLAAMVPMLLYAFSSGPDPRYTAAPGDNPMACANAGCHSGTAQGRSDQCRGRCRHSDLFERQHLYSRARM